MTVFGATILSRLLGASRAVPLEIAGVRAGPLPCLQSQTYGALHNARFAPARAVEGGASLTCLSCLSQATDLRANFRRTLSVVSRMATASIAHRGLTGRTPIGTWPSCAIYASKLRV